MSLQDTIQTLKIKAPSQKIQVGNDSLALGNSFRTPIMQIEQKQPAHLTQQKSHTPTPQLKYQFLSHEDSIFLNLIKVDNGFFQNSSLQLLNHKPSENTSIVGVEEKTETIQLTKDSIASGPTRVQEKNKLITHTEVPTRQAKSRKTNAFNDSKEWLSGFIVMALIIAGLVKISAGKYIHDLFSAVRYPQSASKLFSSFNLQNQKPGWALSALFVLTSSLLIFEYTIIFGKSPNSFSKLLFLLATIGGILLFFGIKTVLYRMVSFVFETSNQTNEYIFNADILSKVFGITILPIVSIIPFVDYLTSSFLLKAGLALFLIMYSIQLLRGVKIILRSPLSIFYMFLYFCALEILPLSILIKLMIL